ncbi:hypothetical protein EJ06DRAFT_525527, partial [Trichodelitschia bisporula]
MRLSAVAASFSSSSMRALAPASWEAGTGRARTLDTSTKGFSGGATTSGKLPLIGSRIQAPQQSRESDIDRQHPRQRRRYIRSSVFQPGTASAIRSGRASVAVLGTGTGGAIVTTLSARSETPVEQEDECSGRQRCMPRLVM